jgi:hypothetical protein
MCLLQWRRGIRHELSSPARTIGSWFRIPLAVWMSLCVYSVFVLFCLYVATLRRADPSSKESYRLCIGLRNKKKRGQGPTKSCRAIDDVILFIRTNGGGKRKTDCFCGAQKP